MCKGYRIMAGEMPAVEDARPPGRRKDRRTWRAAVLRRRVNGEGESGVIDRRSRTPALQEDGKTEGHGGRRLSFDD
jgi:hypothetical protein